MPATYDSIASTRLTNNATSTITFSSISSAYTDLRLVFTGYSSSGNMLPGFRINGATTNYYWIRVMADGSSTYSAKSSGVVDRFYFCDSEITATTTVPVLGTVDIFSYASTSVRKSMLITGNNDKNGSGYVAYGVGYRPVTGAITSIDILAGANNFGSGTTATLYGILRA